jgi:hypothetical protein
MMLTEQNGFFMFDPGIVFALDSSAPLFLLLLAVFLNNVLLSFTSCIPIFPPKFL